MKHWRHLLFLLILACAAAPAVATPCGPAHDATTASDAGAVAR